MIGHLKNKFSCTIAKFFTVHQKISFEVAFKIEYERTRLTDCNRVGILDSSKTSQSFVSVLLLHYLKLIRFAALSNMALERQPTVTCPLRRLLFECAMAVRFRTDTHKWLHRSESLLIHTQSIERNKYHDLELIHNIHLSQLIFQLSLPNFH